MHLGKINSYFGEGTVLKGALKFSGVLRFDGDFEGEIITDDTFIIGETGKVRANVKVGNLHNFGDIKGDVEALKGISLHSNSKLSGNMKTPSLTTEEWAFFNGSCEMTNTDGAKHPTASGSRQTLNAALPRVEGMSLPVEGAETGSMGAGALKWGAGAVVGLVGVAVITWMVLSGRETPSQPVAPTVAVSAPPATPEASKPAKQTQEQAEPSAPKSAPGVINAVSDQDVARLKKDIEKDPKNPEAHLTLSRIYLDKRDYKSAIASLEDAVKPLPNNEEIRAVLGQTYHRTGREKDALKHFNALAQINSNSVEAINNTAFLKAESGGLNQAEALFKKALESKPGNFRARLGLAVVHSKREENDKAVQECMGILKEADDYAPAMNRLAWIYAKKGSNLTEALKLSEKSLSIFDDIPEYLDTLSEVNHRAGNNAEAVKLTKRAIELVPGEPYYKRQLFKFQKAQKSGGGES
jgi:cytoskeletal protein CcmA (bactofilin family)/tetratricopeptide (TPR) repeat protein